MTPLYHDCVTAFRCNGVKKKIPSCVLRFTTATITGALNIQLPQRKALKAQQCKIIRTGQQEGWFCFLPCTKRLCGPHRLRGRERNWDVLHPWTPQKPLLIQRKALRSLIFAERNSAMGLHPSRKKKS